MNDFRLWISLNWLLGTIFFGVALLYPFIDNQFISGQRLRSAERLVDAIFRQEKLYFTQTERYRLFGPGEMPEDFRDKVGLHAQAEQNFVFDAYNRDGYFIIRARVSPQRLRDGTLPPAEYLFKKNLSTGKVERSWTRLSDKKPGLINAIF
ncbi:hypothetical protein ACQZV8_00050 [Magnetococcales bacterium HHB-1]